MRAGPCPARCFGLQMRTRGTVAPEQTGMEFAHTAIAKPSCEHFFFAPDQIPTSDLGGQKG
ncbi:hypothetical protein OA90_12615 [Labrenzia sp. OB1]|nr:hypothetical protein OA90_12615 [Labrenzia sp. OB1]